ncbi:hypothetical protein HDV00_010654 [Rhizophlyctis rosea]|nr:hypothetical protein HDV00_010654 [Rhizophlyctis rosea]
MFSTRTLTRAVQSPAAVSITARRSILDIPVQRLIDLGTDQVAAKEKGREVPAIVTNPQGREIFPGDAISGCPPEVSRRSVRIFKPSKTAMQSGVAGTKYWRIDFDIQERWENPLMGWATSHDPVQGVRMNFHTKEDAILFAERQGYDYWVEEPKREKERVKNYSDNFKYVPGKLRIIKTK